jgi:molybdopterin synthase sulfur carrier subunit
VITLRYFASLREALGTGEERIPLPDGVDDVAGLTRWLQARDDTWREALAERRLHVAVNRRVVAGDTTVSDGDEVAWFPPVTGG